MSKRQFSSPLDALICAEGAAADILQGTGELAKEAEKLLDDAFDFLREYFQEKGATPSPAKSVAANKISA